MRDNNDVILKFRLGAMLWIWNHASRNLLDAMLLIATDGPLQKLWSPKHQESTEVSKALPASGGHTWQHDQEKTGSKSDWKNTWSPHDWRKLFLSVYFAAIAPLKPIVYCEFDFQKKW